VEAGVESQKKYIKTPAKESVGDQAAITND
jgi:hypothetical protein